MNSICRNITRIKAELPKNVTLVAVSKYHPIEAVSEAYKSGHRIYAESRPQELVLKAAALPKDIQWHFIGHLQTNKIKMVLPIASLIQSVDSLHLLEEINAAAPKYCPNKKIDILIECHIAHEESKQGFSLEEAFELITKGKYENIRIRGLMGMASLTSDKTIIAEEFNSLKALFDRITAALPAENAEHFDTLSMGMSGDYPIALECGATMVRIGSAIFSE
ncbi:MAG: YggS family pyridoxal phosphate-dependent enzyme [Bacteroidales bacterium]|nr:YggS family pyridoxal phosphate-dependent enzyme [Bacteroidales bacterium]